VCVLDRTRMLMDTGCGHDIITRLRDSVGIDRVILSHSHLDHTSGTWLLNSSPSTEVCVSREGAATIAEAERLAVRFVGQDLSGLWKRIYIPMTGFRGFTFSTQFAHGHEFFLGENRFMALHAPGHLDDHYCMWEPDRKILIGFDIDMSPFGPWYGSYESDIALFEQSLDMIMSLPVETYISSHARPMKGPHFVKRITQYRATFEARDRLILDTLPPGRPATLDEVVDKSPIYAADYAVNPDLLLRFGESQMVEKHLLRLASRGMVGIDGLAGPSRTFWKNP
jgi:glyoxylase-like metal-dependent hydrolase (beta-lactamase superfamily II)